MSGLIILFSLIFSVNTVFSQNTTQYGNFTIQWENFNLLTCAVPISINISRFTCLPAASYVQVDDLDCLNETTVNFDQNTCQISTTAMYTTSATIPMMTTGSQTSTNVQAATSQSQTSAAVAGTSISPTSTKTTSQSQTSAAVAGTSIASTSTTTTRQSQTSAAVAGTSISSASTTTTTATTKTTTTSSTSTGTSSTSTSTSTAMHTTYISATTITNAVTSHANMVAGNGSTNMSIITSTSASTTTTVASGQMFTCASAAYIGPYCNITSDVCTMSQPCLNAATCFPNNTLPAGYSCNCQSGYTGYDCEYDNRACTENTCWHNGTCIPTNVTIGFNNGSNFRCECVEGYNGVYCQLQVNLCGNITCENRGICLTVDFMWKCLCLDSSLYYGDYCQYKTNKLRIREILSKSFASIAIGVISTTCAFILIMDILKYFFQIDPVECERESYRKRLDGRRRARRQIKDREPKFALRFQYVPQT